MKNVNVRFHDLETEIAATRRTAAQKAALAANGKPTTREALLLGFRPVHQMMRSAITAVNSRLLLQSTAFATGRGLIDKDGEAARLAKIISDGEERALTLSAYARPAAGVGKRILLSGLLVLLCLGDAIFNEGGLEHLLGLNFITSQIVALVFSSLLAYMAHEVIPKYVRAEHGSYAKRMVICMLSATAAFIILSLIRADGLPDNLTELVRVLAFTLLSLAAYFVACLIGIRLYDAKLTAATSQEAEAAKELKKVRAEVERAKVALLKLEADGKAQASHAAALAEYGETLRQGIINDAHTIFFDYLKMVYNNRDASTDVAIFDYTGYPEPFETDAGHSGPKTGGGIATLLLPLIALSLLFSCGKKDGPGEVAVTVLVDNSTPISGGYIDAPGLMHFVGLDGNMWQGKIQVSVSKISDVDFEETRTHILDGAERWNSNIDERTEAVAAFGSRVGESLAAVQPPADADLGHSIIYRTVARHATDLHGMPYKRRYLIVFSDLLENSGNVSFYGHSGRRLLKQPEKLEKLFSEQVPLGDLSGVHIYFVHRPSETTNDTFLAASSFFESLFSGHGATVRISATLPVSGY